LGCSPFARHYSGSRGFFPFVWVLRCISSPACLHLPYVFRQGYVRITARGFPHSEIPGSKVVQHLTGAYRSRPRPSSTPGAKASANGSYYLDRKELFCHSAVFKVRAGVPAHLEWFQGSSGGDLTVATLRAFAREEREGTTDLSKLNRNEAAHARPGRTETGTSVVDVEF
jgi:hypothetical protein